MVISLRPLFLSVVCLVVLLPLRAAPTYDQYKTYIARWEGIRHLVYLDPITDQPETGIGHSITPREEWYYGTATLTDDQIDDLFRHDLTIALADAHSLFYHLDSYPDAVQLVVVDLSFNIGYKRLARFKRFRSDCEARRWEMAADDLQNSNWYKQVGQRGLEHYLTLKSLCH